MRLLAVLAAALAWGLPPVATHRFPHFPRGCSRADFASGGSRVPAEFCRAAGRAHGAVIVLHGCGGFSTFDHRIATTLPAYGIGTLDVDYFARTPPPNRRGFCRGGGDAGKALGRWIGIVGDAGAKLRATPGIRSVGIVGWSLGGNVAVAAAGAPGGRRFAAIVSFSGGPFAATDAIGLPPTMLLFGGRTDRKLVRQTRVFCRLLRAARVPCESYVYLDGSHNWPREQGTVGIARAAAFLRTRLR